MGISKAILARSNDRVKKDETKPLPFSSTASEVLAKIKKINEMEKEKYACLHY